MISNIFQRLHIEVLIEAFQKSFRRFPVSAGAMTLAWLIAIAKNHKIISLSDDMAGRTVLFLTLAALFAMTVQLFFRGSSWREPKVPGIILTGAAVMAAAAFIPAHFTVMQVFLIGALILSLLFSPYLARAGSEDSAWYYNYLNLMTVVFGWISSFVFSLGAVAILASIDYLFEVRIESTLYGDAWLTGSILLFSLYILAQWPESFDYQKEDCAPPTGVYFIANYLLVPLTVVYTVILYAYAAKIAVGWSLPRGNLAYMVTGFGVVGVLTHLAVYPMRENGTRLLQFFYKHFYKVLMVPLMLLAIGIYTRISQYGVTEERYAVLLALVWFSALSTLFTFFPRHAHIKHVPAILCFLFLLASSGPWSARSVSSLSQIGRLETLLTKIGVITSDGRVVKATAEIAFEDKKSISSIVDYLFEHNDLAKIDAWVAPLAEGQQKTKEGQDDCDNRFMSRCYSYNNERVRGILSAWGIDYVSSWQGENNGTSGQFFVQSSFRDRDYNAVMGISGYDYYTRLHVSSHGGAWSQERSYTKGQESLKATFLFSTDGQFTIRLADGREVSVSLKALADELYKQKITMIPDSKSDMATLRREENGIRLETRIATLQGRVKDGKTSVESADLIVLFNP